MGRYEMGGAELAPIAETKPNAETFFELGILYATGRDVVADLVAAHKWFNLAALRGSNIAKNWRNQIAEEMNAGQIAQAQKLAREWLSIFK